MFRKESFRGATSYTYFYRIRDEGGQEDSER